MELWGKGSLCAPGIVVFGEGEFCVFIMSNSVGVSNPQWFTGKQNWVLCIYAISQRKGTQDSHKLGLNHCSLQRCQTSNEGGSSVKASGLLFEELRLQLLDRWGQRTEWCLMGSGKVLILGKVFTWLPVTQANHQWPDSCCQIPTRSVGIFAKHTLQRPSYGVVWKCKIPMQLWPNSIISESYTTCDPILRTTCWVSVLLSVILFNIKELLLDKSLMQPSKISLLNDPACLSIFCNS